MIGTELATKAAAFLRDEEQGSATLWNLFWLCGFGALLGLGLDTTAAMNMKGKLQMVADTSAHAAVMDIFPIASDAVDTALLYGSENIDQSDVVLEDDVTIGYWDPDTRTFATDNVPNYNAVRVVATRDTSRDNALGTFFLRLVGFYDWDIKAASTAVYYTDLSETDRCRKNGLLAGGQMEQTSNNVVIGDYCLHGEQGVSISQNNYIECGVEISLPDASLWLNQAVPTPTGMNADCNENYEDLDNDEMVQQVVVYRSMASQAQQEFDNVKSILDAYVDAYFGGETVNDPFSAIPPYITHVVTIDASGFNQLAQLKNGNHSLEAGALYRVNCGGGGSIRLSGLIQNVGIYTDCLIDIKKDNSLAAGEGTSTPPPNHSCAEAISAGYTPYQTILDTAAGETYRDGETVDDMAEQCGMQPGAAGLWDNVFIFTSSPATIQIPNGMQIGRYDGCTEGGAVRLYTAGDIKSPAGIMMHGSHLIVLGEVDLAAQGSAYGVTVEAKGDIKYAAQGQFTGCPAGEDRLASDVVITVRPIAIVQ